MSEIQITFPDESVKNYPQGITPSDIAKSISNRLYKDAIAAKVNGNLVDLSFPLNDDARVEILTYKSPETEDILLHSTSHVMAQAVKRLYPDVKVTIGPAIENRFYYDFDTDTPFKEDDLPRIEEEMRKIISEDLKVERQELSRAEAIRYFRDIKEDYKIEIIEDLEGDGNVSVYRQGEFVDLCRGPHVPSTGKIKAFKLLSVAGAYWRGNENNKMLSRIYGTSFASEKQLKKYLNYLEEAKKRDHRQLGKALGLFETSDKVGQGLILWHPKGAMLWKMIEDFWYSEHFKAGYEIVRTPHIGKSELWETSGHLDFYREAMYSPMDIEGQDYFIKPMNCPFHIQIYKSSLRSYRELPIRYAELGTVYRYEKTGVLHGLLRVRGFTQDDAHIVCTPEQLPEEVEKLIDFSFFFLKSFGFEDYEIFVSTRPRDKYVGSDKEWELATRSLMESLDKKNIKYSIDAGGGAFYGPKIDIKIKDALNRSWQCTTIQFDFNLSHRFDMVYIGEDGKEHRPFMVHRAILGSLERFIGVLIEHTMGDFPLWLAPVQGIILPIADRHIEYAQNIRTEFEKEGLRVNLNLKSDKIGAKIRAAELEKIPFMLIVGDKEIEKQVVSVRRRKLGDLGSFSVNVVIERMKREIINKSKEDWQ